MSGLAPLRNFLKAHFGVQHEDEILPWGRLDETRFTGQTATEHNITATFVFDECVTAGQQVPQKKTLDDCMREGTVEGNANPFNRNIATAGIYGIKGVQVENTYPFYMGLRTSYVHPAMENSIREYEDMLVAGGATRGVVKQLNPYTEKSAMEVPFLGVRSYHFQQPDFVRCMANVTPYNLMRGIVRIPRSVCIECDQEQFPVYRPEEPHLEECEELEEKILFWYFVPTDHVLAWPFTAPPQYRAQMLWNVLEYRVRRRDSGEVFILGYLVSNRTLNRCRRDFLRMMAGKVHVSDLRQLDVEAVPIFNVKTPSAKISPPTTGTHSGRVSVRVRIAYYLYETLTEQQINQLCPALSPDFPPFTNWIIKDKL